MLRIETDDAIYEVGFQHVQINVTARCNMRCEHCRGAYEDTTDLSVEDFTNLILFSRQHIGERGGYLLTGGEPLLHPQFKELLTILSQHIGGSDFLSIATNGTFVTEKLLDYLNELSFSEIRISVSLDSVDPARHNLFRHAPRGYQDSVRAIRLISEREGVQCIVRATIQADQIAELGAMAELVKSLGADILSVSSIIPSGRARNRPEFEFGKEAKKALMNRVKELRGQCPQLVIDVNDPLAYIDTAYKGQCGEYGGCIAGIGTFSVEPDGTMLPCPLLHNQVIANVKGMSPEMMEQAYTNSPYIHALIERQLTDACGECELRFTCGGCRARAEAATGSYLGTDPDCWLERSCP